jgi:mRNA interferase RelE/StbE
MLVLEKLIGMFNIIFDKSAEKDLENLPNNLIRRVLRVIEKLADDPKPIGVKKLKGSDEDLYRIRSGDYRIVYAINDSVKIVNIRRIRHRKEVYRNL